MLIHLPNPAWLMQHAKNAVQACAIAFNRRCGREFVPPRGRTLNIEVSSACNLNCRICAYPKKTGPKVAMSNDVFCDVVRQALALGFSEFHLTPCTGDVFMDRHLFDKLDFLDDEPGVACYSFFTNFTVPDAADIRRLFGLRKFGALHVSIYGHDRDSFIAITRATGRVYGRLLANLDTLYALLPQRRFALEFSVKSSRRARRAHSDLTESLARFRRAGLKVRSASGLYNNWGGLVMAEDLQGLGMRLKGEDAVYKFGACSLLFDQVQVTATGIVNGCACRDAEATLRIGDVTRQPLRDVLSVHNDAYVALIDEQQSGAFRPVCRSCDFYKSIYKPGGGGQRRNARSIDAFWLELETRACRSRDLAAPMPHGQA